MKNPEKPKFSGFHCFGAGDGNRTHAASLEGWNTTIVRHPRKRMVLYHNGISLSTFYFEGSSSVKTKTFWNNFGKKRVITVINGQISLDNVK